MPDPVVGVPAEEAIAYLKQKVNLPTRTWTDLWEGMHARAFVVAGAMRDELLADLHEAVTSAIADGTTAREFRARFEEIVARNGWTGWTGEGSKKGRRWRARVIYDTNLRSARAAGRWQQIQRLKDRRPYLRYTAVLDSSTRPEHEGWHGTILPADHPFWQTHYPPNGWYCRCTVVQLSDADLKRRGWQVTEAPEVRMVLKDIKGRGRVETPEGIDPGFGHNAGIAASGRQLAEDVMDTWRRQGADAWEILTPGDWRSAGRPETIPADAPRARLGPPAADQAAMEAAVTRAIGGEERVFVTPAGSRVMINASAFAKHVNRARAPFVPFLPEITEGPFEVWLTFERHRGTGKIQLRMRALKALDLANRGYAILVAQAVRGVMEAWTLVPTDSPTQFNRWRRGQLLWGRGTVTEVAGAVPGAG